MMSDFDFIAASRKVKAEESEPTPPQKFKRKRKSELQVEPIQPVTRNSVGRPRNGKRSNPEWVGRTFYVKSETDLTLGIAIATLKAQGVQLDKSDLVEMLLSEWLEMRPGEKLNWCESKFSN